MTLNATNIHLLPAPERTTPGISEPPPALRKLVVAFEPPQKLRVPVAHYDPSVRSEARASVETLPATATPTPYRHWGINE